MEGEGAEQPDLMRVLKVVTKKVWVGRWGVVSYG